MNKPMKTLWQKIKTHWRLLTQREFYVKDDLTAEEFKKLWNDSLEEMKIRK